LRFSFPFVFLKYHTTAIKSSVFIELTLRHALLSEFLRLSCGAGGSICDCVLNILPLWRCGGGDDWNLVGLCMRLGGRG
jgi:hypothetical protein